MADNRFALVPAGLLLTVEASILAGPPLLRIPAGLVLGLVLPGGAVISLISRRPMSAIERVLLIAGLSIAIAILAGLVMSAVGVRLTMHSWAVALGLVTAAGIARAAVVESHRRPRTEGAARSRGNGAPGAIAPGVAGRRIVLADGSDRWYGGDAMATMAEGETLRVGRDADGPSRHTGKPASEQASGGKARLADRRVRLVMAAGFGVSALAAIAGAFAIGISGEHYRGPGFTELWALPSPSGARAARLGLISHERHDARYTLRVSVNGRVIRAQQLTLRPGATWRSTQPVGSTPQDVRFVLEKSPSDSVYREVHLSAGEFHG